MSAPAVAAVILILSATMSTSPLGRDRNKLATRGTLFLVNPKNNPTRVRQVPFIGDFLSLCNTKAK